jgi:hypothetical protein
VGEKEWVEIRAQLAPISDRYLRDLLRATGIPLAPLVEGIRQDSFEQLERTLVAMESEYSRARAEGDNARMQACRRAVIEAKEHARLALRRAGVSPEKRKEKEEMIEWMLVWLENPGVFPRWAELKR